MGNYKINTIVAERFQQAGHEVYLLEQLNGRPYDHEYAQSHEELETGDNLDVMGPVLGTVPVPLVVELGRVETNARELMHMRMGQILELRRSPYEPLDLVVNGQVYGKGELVEIEGQIGLKIVKLYR